MPARLSQYVAIHGRDGNPVGGGCLVAKRRIITCAHVVEAALGFGIGKLLEAPKDHLKVRFTFAAKAFNVDCRVVHWNPVHNGYPLKENEDLALLEVLSDLSDDIEVMEVPRRALSRIPVFCYKAGQNGGSSYGTINDDLCEGGRIQINKATSNGIRIEPGFSGAPLISADGNDLFCGIVMTGRQDPEDQTIFGKSPAYVREVIDLDAENGPTRNRLDSDQAAEYLAVQRRLEFGTSNPYLLGKHFYGRRREQEELTKWLCSNEKHLASDYELQDVRIFCICDLGGTGKSALVDHWLNMPSTKQALRDNGLPTPFWASFYSKDFSFPDMLERLKDYLGISLGRDFVVCGDDAYRRTVVKKILAVLMKTPALIVFDGLEREMGAFNDSVNRGLDSEQQDVRAESLNVPTTERYLRETVFQDLLLGLVMTKAKVILTTRHVPEELRDLQGTHRRVHVHPLGPLDAEDACKIWNDTIGQNSSGVDEFVLRFFDLVGYHPCSIVIVASSLASDPDKRSLKQWFESFEVELQLRCTDRDALKTSLRHRWIDLATRDLKLSRRKAWNLLVEIAHSASAIEIETLKNITIRDSLNTTKGRPLFENGDQFDVALDLLQYRRLIGVSNQDVDMHPVIRTHVRQWAFAVFRDPSTADEETLRAVKGDGDGELAQRFWASDIEQQFLTLKTADPERRDELVGGQSMLRQKLAEMYQQGTDRSKPWMSRLPRFAHRRVQADCVYLTANALMVNGDWEDSRYLYRVAKELYELCGDSASIGDCMWSMNWQLIYGGDLLESERTVVGSLLKEDPTKLKTVKNLFWLILLLSVRKHPSAQRLLQIVDKDFDRWTLQAASETSYYLEDYSASRHHALQALRSDERIGRRQELWEWVSLGLAAMRVSSYEQSFESLGRARASGIGLGYEIITLFALAGLTEAHAECSFELSNTNNAEDSLSKGISAHNQYRILDAQDRYQIPATDAHLSAAMIFEALGQRENAITWAIRALEVATRSGSPFVYASGERRAITFLTKIGAESSPKTSEGLIIILKEV